MPDQRSSDADADARSEPDSNDHEDRPDQRIRVGQRADGSPFYLPVERVLTGRLFLTGKSGSGKSNTASVVIEELLDRGFPVAIVDTDGEYYGLKEEYELLHAGADEECDIQVGPEHTEKLATMALEENVPIILDVSGYLDESEASELIRETARHLFAKEKKLKKPFLLVVEEVHEYVPEGGGMDDTGRMLVKVGKRGRKHGLGIVGVSQRPADVKKDFITQANCLVWHRLTWNNDTKVVKRIVGSEYGQAVSELDAGEAFVQADWTDEAVTRVQFRRKRTFDAGATPGLEDFERPELKSVSDGLMGELSEITEQQQRERDRIEELEDELERKEARIEDLQAELDRARDVSAAAEQVASAVAEDLSPEVYQARLGAKNTEIDRLHDRIAALEERMERLAPDDPDPASLSAFEADEGTGEGDGADEGSAGGDRPPGEGPDDADPDRDESGDRSLVPDDPNAPGDADTGADSAATAPDDQSSTDPEVAPVPEANPEEVAAAVADVTDGTAPPPSGDPGEGDGTHAGAGAGQESVPDPDSSPVAPSSDPGDDREDRVRSGDDRKDRKRTGDDAGEGPGTGREGLSSYDRAFSDPPGTDPVKAGDGIDAGSGDDAPESDFDPADARYFTTGDGELADPADLARDPFSEYESIESYLDDVDERDGHTPHVDRANGRFRRARHGGDPETPSGDESRTETASGPAATEGSNGAAEFDASPPSDADGDEGDRIAELLRAEPVAVKLRAAIRGAQCNEAGAKRVLSTLAEEGPVVFEAAAESADVPPENAYSLLSALRARDLVTRDRDHRYALDRSGMEGIVEAAGDGPHHELQEQWNVE